MNRNEEYEDLYKQSIEFVATSLLKGEAVSEKILVMVKQLGNLCGAESIARDIIKAGAIVTAGEEDNTESAKTLRIDSQALEERNRAFVEAMSSPFRQMLEGIQRERERRYEEMIDELPLVDSPMSRRR